MKHIYGSLLALVMSLCMLLGTLPVSAVYAWEEGSVPVDWEQTSAEDKLEAVNILEPVNANASDEAKNLLAYLSQFTDSNRMLTGTFDYTDDNKVYNMVSEEFGKECVIYSNRYKLRTDGSMTFSNLEAANARRVEHYNNGNILLVHSDQFEMESVITNKALELGVTTDASGTNLIAQLDISNPDREMALYALYKAYLDNYAEGLQAMENAGVKAYMLRFWIEFNYRKFCGEEACYAHFTRVYQQTVQHFIDYGLTGFLITFSPGATNDCLTRYPGNEYVDVLSATHYSKENTLGALDGKNHMCYDWFLQSGKPFGFAEFSCRSSSYERAGLYPRPTWYTTLRDIMTYWPRTGWALAWDDSNFGLMDNRESPKYGTDDGKLFLDSPFTVTLDEAADYGNYQGETIAPVGVAQFYYTGNASDTRIGMEERTYTAAMLAERGIDLTDVEAVRVCTGYALRIFGSEDCTGTPLLMVMEDSQKYLDGLVMAKARSCEIVRYEDNRVEPNSVTTTNVTKTGDITNISDGYDTIGWQGEVGNDGCAYIEIDLGETHLITSYTLKNATYAQNLGVGTTGYALNTAEYNSRAWKLQYSDDNRTWKEADSVSANTDGLVERPLNEVSARYFRLVITDPNEISGTMTNFLYGKRVTIAEFELYGVSIENTYAARTQVVTSAGSQLRDGEDDTNYHLRFAFDLVSDGIGYAGDGYRRKLDENSIITIDGKSYMVRDFGAVVSVDPHMELILENVKTRKVKRVRALNLYDESDDGVRYTVVTVNIPEEEKHRVIYARPYVIYQADGEERVLYGAPYEDSVFDLLSRL